MNAPYQVQQGFQGVDGQPFAWGKTHYVRDSPYHRETGYLISFCGQLSDAHHDLVGGTSTALASCRSCVRIARKSPTSVLTGTHPMAPAALPRHRWNVAS